MIWTDLVDVDIEDARLLPITITIQQLKTLGFLPYIWGQFEGLMEHYTDPKKKIFLRFHKEGVSIFTEGMIAEVFNYIVQIKYFHQLQNIYFDLLGVEIGAPVDPE